MLKEYTVQNIWEVLTTKEEESPSPKEDAVEHKDGKDASESPWPKGQSSTEDFHSLRQKGKTMEEQTQFQTSDTHKMKH